MYMANFSENELDLFRYDFFYCQRKCEVHSFNEREGKKENSVHVYASLAFSLYAGLLIGPIGSDSRNCSYEFADLEIWEKSNVFPMELLNSNLARRIRGRTKIYPRMIKAMKASAPKTPPRIPPTERRQSNENYRERLCIGLTII